MYELMDILVLIDINEMIKIFKIYTHKLEESRFELR
jgi:hypothetical protein